MRNRVSTGGSFPFYIFQFLATSSWGFWAKGHTQSLSWTLSCFFVVVVFNINICSDSKMSVEWQHLIQNYLHLLGLYFSQIHYFVFISTIFSLPLYYPGSWCKIPVLISQAAFVFGYWKQRCIISRLGYPLSFQAHLWMRWTMQDLAQSPSPAFLL